MNEAFRIYIKRLQNGKIEQIDEKLDPSFLDISEKGVSFTDPVEIHGTVYLADEYLILQFSVSTRARLACSMCNEECMYEVPIPSWVHEELISEIRDGVFDFSQVLRETILLELPYFPQCGGDSCLNRKEIEKYLRKEADGDVNHDEKDGYQPFRDVL